MLKLSQVLIFAGLIALPLKAGFLQDKAGTDLFLPNPWDPSSFANVDRIQTTHFALDISVDFDKSSILGTNTLDLTAAQDGISEVVLDYQGMTISKVELADGKGRFTETNNFETHDDYNLGSAMRIFFTDKLAKGATTQIRLTYATNKDAEAINWLTKAQTSTGTLQYLFTQCEPIHCRSVAPLQDSPSIKTTYSAKVTVQAPYVVKMSANETDPVTNKDGTITYNFENTIKIPSYLLAIAVGNLAYTSTGTRTGVIAEPGKDFLDRYAKELEDLETYLDETEKWLTPYIWGKYTILILPPSFPFGGMENPLLTFASPTIIVGDKSQVYVATHEIAHSWTGNDVTCRDWSNMWLNEGFTVFEERKVSGKLHTEEFAKIEAQLGDVDLWVDINNYGVSSSYSSLYPVLNGHSPDDSFSEVPYEKGFQFLTYLESLVGADNFQAWIRLYILNFAQQSITYLEMKAHFIDWVTNTLYKGDQKSIDKVLNAIDWAAWIQQGGKNPPAWNISFATDSAKTYEKLADDYITLQGTDHPKNYDIYLKETDPQLKVIFLNRLISRQNELNYNLLVLIDADYNCTWDKNPEIGQRWLPLAIAMGYEEAYGDNLSGAHYYVSYQGRMKYINPIYQQLVRYGRRDLAYKWFSEFQNFYHPIAVAGLKKIIFASVDAEEEKLLNRTMKALASGRIRL